MTAPATFRRRPKYGDPVVLNGTRYFLAAMVFAPKSGYLLRPHGAADAAKDLLVSREEWAGLRWNPRREQWERL